MEDKLDHGFIKNNFESPQYGESTFSDSGHVIYQNDRLKNRYLFWIVQGRTEHTFMENIKRMVRYFRTDFRRMYSITRYRNTGELVNRYKTSFKMKNESLKWIRRKV